MVDSPSFQASFERWRIAVTSLVPSTTATLKPLRCEESQSPAWDTVAKEVSKETEGEKTEKDLKREAKECKRCEKWRDELVRESPIVRFLLQHISLLPPSPDYAPPTANPTPNLPLPVTCAPCPPTLAGGYSPTLGILLCQNRFMSRRHMEDALSHELIHAWDGRRFKVGESEWGKDLRAHACTEIRAESLSGDCRFMREVNRHNYAFTKQHQVCVRRRAILSVAANPNCRSKEEAEKTVNEVWESCFNDTRPFDEIY